MSDHTKRCAGCQETFGLDSFYKRGFRNGKQRFASRCKECTKDCNRKNYSKHRTKRIEDHKKYREANRDKLNQRSKEYYRKNREARIEYRMKYVQSNKDAVSDYHKKYTLEKYHSDPQTKIKMNLSNRMRTFFSKDGDRTIDFIGCSIDELKLHLEKQFVDGMSWENYGLHGWHVDHIRPCCSFDLTDPEQQRECFHYTNLQPLWAQDNLSKGGRY